MLQTSDMATRFWFLMTENGIGNGSFSVATFGPFRDLSAARVCSSRLGKRGLACVVADMADASNRDKEGVALLVRRFPYGVDA